MKRDDLDSPCGGAADGHFLSAQNPLATIDQIEIERTALELLATPLIQAARQQAGNRLRVLAAAHLTDEAAASFEQTLDEWAYQLTLKAINGDANYPRVFNHMYAAPHRWFDLDVPGSRGIGGDNPDNNYIVAPIAPDARYELSGQRYGEGPPDSPIGIYGNLSLSMTIAVLDWQDVRFDDDGRFTISIGPDAADGRAHHLQTNADARYLLVREALADWRAKPCAYRIRRLDPPSAPPMTREQIAARAARFIVDDVAPSHWWLAMVNATPLNTLSAPLGASNIGGLVTQKMSWARLRLADDEAFVLHVQHGGAAYRGLVLMDYWQHSLDLPDHTCSLSNAQSLPNDDGSFTYVVSVADPGVHNWLDPCGLREPRLMHRWQGLPPSSPSGEAAIRGEVVKLAELDRWLPASTPRISLSQRHEQLRRRREEFLSRFAS